MADPVEQSEMIFILTDGTSKPEGVNRKLIRRHVMIGKNQTKFRRRQPKSPAVQVSEAASGTRDGKTDLLMNIRYPKLHAKVGSDLSFTKFAAPVEPSYIQDLMQFSLRAKGVMYPLERCIVFHKDNKVDTTYFQLLTSDAAYLHAAVFALRAYVDIVSVQRSSVTPSKALAHHSKALHILRQRLTNPDRDKISDSTILVVLCLTFHAYFVNDFDTAKHHIEGLHKIVETRGGLSALNYNTKLILEILRCDLSIAVNNGVTPTFFNGPGADPLMPYDLTPPLATESQFQAMSLAWQEIQRDIAPELTRSWTALMRFCASINSAFTCRRPLPKEVLLNAMGSVMYRLLRMRDKFEPDSSDEVIRLGLLVFSTNIFLSWKDVRLSHTFLPNTYRQCLLGLKTSSVLPPQVLAWLLMIGAISTFTSADDTWLLPWLRCTVMKCKVHDWAQFRAHLKAFLWVDILHDRPGQAVYDTAMSLSAGS